MPERGNKPAFATLALVILNITLAAFVWNSWRHGSNATRVTRVSSNEVAEGSTLDPAKEKTPGESRSEVGHKVLARWRDLESHDLRMYIANLRKIECPEETIQDIILAEVGRLFHQREISAGLDRSQINVWEYTDGTRQVNVQRNALQRELHAEKQALIRDLLGIELPQETEATLTPSTANNRFQAALEFLPNEKQGPVRRAQLEYTEGIAALRQKTDGIYLPEDLVEWQKLVQGRTDRLKQVLTPQELQDLELRTSTTADNLKRQLSAFDFTEAEFRKLFELNDQFQRSNQSPGILAGDHTSFQKTAADAQATLAQEINGSFTPGRLAEYHRAQDSRYQQIFQATRNANVPKEALARAWDANQIAEQTLRQFAAGANLTDPGQAAALDGLKQQFTQQLTALVGGEAAAKLQSQLPAFRIGPPKAPKRNPQP